MSDICGWGKPVEKTQHHYKLWVVVLIKAVFIMMTFIRAEREGDWSLHLGAFSQMMPNFFAAGHIHYAYMV